MSKINNTIINYIIPVTVAFIVYIIYRYYNFLFVSVKENFKNKSVLCNDDSCGMGCEKPNKINDSCPSTIYKDVDGKCHRKCPYICSNKSKSGCKYNQCCIGCGYTKFNVPCELADDNADNDDPNKEPSPNKDKNTTSNSTSKSKNLDNNMTDIDHQDMNFKGWSPFVTKWPCSLNVTGTFTECGPPGYNSCSERSEFN